MILHTEFGLIWTTPWTDEKDLFLKFANRIKIALLISHLDAKTIENFEKV